MLDNEVINGKYQWVFPFFINIKLIGKISGFTHKFHQLVTMLIENLCFTFMNTSTEAKTVLFILNWAHLFLYLISNYFQFPTLQSSSRTCLSSSEFSSHAWSPSPSAQFSSPEQLESHCCRRDCPGKKMAQLVLSLIVDFNCFHAPSAARTINNSAWGEGRRKEIVVENVFLMHTIIFLQFYTRQARKKIPHSHNSTLPKIPRWKQINAHQKSNKIYWSIDVLGEKVKSPS